jgi:hypothetical protein
MEGHVAQEAPVSSLFFFLVLCVVCDKKTFFDFPQISFPLVPSCLYFCSSNPTPASDVFLIGLAVRQYS